MATDINKYNRGQNLLDYTTFEVKFKNSINNVKRHTMIKIMF